MNNFVKWLIIFVASVVLQYFTWSSGVLSEILETDITYICLGIMSMFWCASVYCGGTLLSNKNKNLARRIGWFLSDTFTALGFLGTVIGMIFGLQSFASFNPSDASSTIDVINQMTSGMSVALYTTLVGLVYARILMLEFFLLGDDNEI